MPTERAQRASLNRAIGKALLALRKEKDITQEKLADLCNINRSTISDIETGSKSADSFTLYKITNNLEVSLSQLFKHVYVFLLQEAVLLQEKK